MERAPLPDGMYGGTGNQKWLRILSMLSSPDLQSGVTDKMIPHDLDLEDATLESERGAHGTWKWLVSGQNRLEAHRRRAGMVRGEDMRQANDQEIKPILDEASAKSRHLTGVMKSLWHFGHRRTNCG